MKIKDIAREAGVSSAAVSRALRGTGYVSAQTRALILKTAEELGYVADLQAQALRTNTSKTIGVIVSDINNPFFSMVLMEMITELKKQGYSMMLGYSNEDPEAELENLKLMLASRVAGIIMTPVNHANRDFVRRIENSRISLLQLYRQAYSSINSLVVDDEKGAYLATRHLIENGHTDILMLGVESEVSPNRMNGYLSAINEAGLPVQKHLMINSAPNQDVKGVFWESWTKHRFTAVVAGTNTFGLDVYAVCNDKGISVPDELSMVVFDDVPWVSGLNFSAIAQPINGIATTAVSILLSWINDDTSREDVTNIKIEPKLISRRSVQKRGGNP